MNNMEKLKLSLGDPVKKIIGGQEFEFLPLGVDSLPEFFELQNRIKNNPDDILKKENAELLVGLLLKFLKINFKDADDEFLNRFCMKYISEIQAIFMELHVPSEETKVNAEEMKKKFLEQNPNLKK